MALGRGVNDCKNSLMGIFGAMERLVTEGFEPERTILVANGFDEEVSACIIIGKIAVLIGLFRKDKRHEGISQDCDPVGGAIRS